MKDVSRNYKDSPIGYVKSFEAGTFYVKNVKGNIHKLKEGEVIYHGDLVYGAPNNRINAHIIIGITSQEEELIITKNSALLFDAPHLEGVFNHPNPI